MISGGDQVILQPVFVHHALEKALCLPDDQILPGHLYGLLARLREIVNRDDAFYLSQQPLKQSQITSGDADHTQVFSGPIYDLQFGSSQNLFQNAL